MARPKKEGAGKAGCRLAPTVRCAHVAQKGLHSGIQVKPNTRPSLRDGRTAYAVLSREPTFPFGLPRPANWRCRPPGWARAHLRERLDRSNDGQDHTVLPYAAHPASPRGFAGLRRRSSTRGHGLTGTTRPARTSRADAAASIATRPALRTTREPPLFVGRAVSMYAAIPNFG